jgi:hypothetical protein
MHSLKEPLVKAFLNMRAKQNQLLLEPIARRAQMRSPLIAVVLCILANAAAAQCVVPNAGNARTTPDVVKASVAAAAPAHAGGELIKAAAAGTRDEIGPPSATVMPRTPQARVASDTQEHPRRSGTAMLLAALALMSGIALRRSGSGPQ